MQSTFKANKKTERKSRINNFCNSQKVRNKGKTAPFFLQLKIRGHANFKGKEIIALKTAVFSFSGDLKNRQFHPTAEKPVLHL